MEEENQEKQKKDGIIKKTGNELKKGAKKQAKKAVQKVVKKIIMAILPYLLKAIAFTIIVIIITISIKNFIDKLTGDASKDANAFAVKYTASSTGGVSSNTGSGSTGSPSNSGETASQESSLNNIVVDFNNITENGAYKLTYEFRDKDGNLYSEEQAITNIKEDLLKVNEKLDITQFSNSELKIIGALMYNGLMVESYDEKELKALVIFLKADIASQSFNLRNRENTDIDIESLRQSDEIYGTLELHKTTIETDESGNIKYKPIKLQYIPYGDEVTRRNFLLYGCTKR